MKKLTVFVFGLISLLFVSVFVSTEIKADTYDFDVSFTLHYDGSVGNVIYNTGDYDLFHNIVSNTNYTLSEEGAISPNEYRIINNQSLYTVTDLIFTNSSFQEGLNIIKVEWGDVNDLTTATPTSIKIFFMAKDYNTYEITIISNNTYTVNSDNENVSFNNVYNYSTFAIRVELDPDIYYWYQKGLDNGYDNGYQDGLIDSNDTAFNDGFNQGIESVYYDGFDGFINPSTNQPYDYKYSYPYGQGYNDGLQADTDYSFTGILFQVFGGLGALFSIEMLPNITIGAIVAVPLVFGIIYFILGKRSKD